MVFLNCEVGEGDGMICYVCFFSYYEGGFNVLMCDGLMCFVCDNIDLIVWVWLMMSNL